MFNPIITASRFILLTGVHYALRSTLSVQTMSAVFSLVSTGLAVLPLRTIVGLLIRPAIVGGMLPGNDLVKGALRAALARVLLEVPGMSLYRGRLSALLEAYPTELSWIFRLTSLGLLLGGSLWYCVSLLFLLPLKVLTVLFVLQRLGLDQGGALLAAFWHLASYLPVQVFDLWLNMRGIIIDIVTQIPEPVQTVGWWASIVTITLGVLYGFTGYVTEHTWFDLTGLMSTLAILAGKGVGYAIASVYYIGKYSWFGMTYIWSKVVSSWPWF